MVRFPKFLLRLFLNLLTLLSLCAFITFIISRNQILLCNTRNPGLPVLPRSSSIVFRDHAAWREIDKAVPRNCVLNVWHQRLTMIGIEKCVSICPHSELSIVLLTSNASPFEADLRRTFAAHCISINQRTGLLRSFLFRNKWNWKWTAYWWKLGQKRFATGTESGRWQDEDQLLY